MHTTKLDFALKNWKWEEIVQHFANANEIKTRNAINRVCFFWNFLKVDFFRFLVLLSCIAVCVFGGGWSWKLRMREVIAQTGKLFY